MHFQDFLVQYLCGEVGLLMGQPLFFGLLSLFRIGSCGVIYL